MKKIITLQFALLLCGFFTHCMYEKSESEKSNFEEPTTNENNNYEPEINITSKDYKTIIKDKIQKLKNNNYDSLPELNDDLDSLFNECNQQVKSDLMKACIKPVLLKIREIELRSHVRHKYYRLFDDTVIKYNFVPLISAARDNDLLSDELSSTKNHLGLHNLPPELIAHILRLGLDTSIDESFAQDWYIDKIAPFVSEKSLAFIFNSCEVSKHFYSFKQILINHLKNAAEQAIFNKVLNVSSMQGYYLISEILITSRKVNIDSRGYNNRTPLINAVIGNNQQIVKLLLKNGARTELKDNSDKTALLHAIQVSSDEKQNNDNIQEIIALLKAKI